MRLSNRQKALLHMVPAALGIDEAQRRVIQRNVGGFFSAADRTVSREGFIAVMAFYEGRAGGRLAGFSGGYWAGESRRAGATDALVVRIRRQAAEIGWSEADAEALLAGPHMSDGACRTLADASTYWLSRLLQALIEMGRRHGRASQRA